MFAAWPLVYAAAFSGFYVAMLLVLFALFLRPVGFDYRSKVADPRWRSAWDWGLFVGGFVPALVFGVAFGNLLVGRPLPLRRRPCAPSTRARFFDLLNPFGLARGPREPRDADHARRLLSAVAHRGRRAGRGPRARRASPAIVCPRALRRRGLWIATGMDGYRIVDDAAAGFRIRAAGEDRRARARRLARQLCDVSVDDRRAGRPPWRPRCWRWRCVRAAPPGLAFVLSCVGVAASSDRRLRDVPVHHAVVEPPGEQPHGLGCGVEPPDAADHVLGGADLHAADRRSTRAGSTG